MRATALLALPALAIGCASATQAPAPLEAVSVGVVSRLDGGGARPGMSFAYWTAGFRGWGAFAKLRVDAGAGLGFLFYEDDEHDHDPYLDDHVGAVVYDMGLVYRFADNFAVYGGAGLGNKYEYSVERVDHHEWDRTIHSLDWDPNLTTGVLWLWGGSGGGMEFGWDSFDRSFRIALLVNYGGTNENWLD
jgi:hypothetical protein